MKMSKGYAESPFVLKQCRIPYSRDEKQGVTDALISQQSFLKSKERRYLTCRTEADI